MHSTSGLMRDGDEKNARILKMKNPWTNLCFCKQKIVFEFWFDLMSGFLLFFVFLMTL